MSLLMQFIVTHGLLAQIEPKIFPPDTARYLPERQNIAILGFDKNLSTYQWSGIVNFKTFLGPLRVDVDERYRSEIIATQQKLVRDEQVFNFGLKQPVGGRFSALVRANNFVLSDDRRISGGQRQSLTTASSNAAYGGIEVMVVPQLFVESAAGMRFDSQMGVRDRGFSYALEIRSPGFDFDGYRTLLAGRFQRDLVQPRTLERRSFLLNVEKVFFPGTRDTLGVEYFSHQRDFYFSADSLTIALFNVSQNIERRVEEVIAVSNVLEYTVSERAFLSLYGNLSMRDINRRYRYRPLAAPSQTLLNSTVDEFRIGGIAQFRYSVADDITTAVQFLFNERDENHTLERDDRISVETNQRRQGDEARKDNISRRSMLAASLDARVSSSDTIRFSGSASILRYDTPHLENVDDRDELWYSLNLTTFHRLNPYVHLKVAADVNLAHLVYLFADRSGSNSWNRVIRLAPAVHYVPSRAFSTTNTFEVLANYTVFDFESSPFVQVSSFSFRQFALIDSTRWKFSPHFAWEGSVHVRLYQRGELRWDEFRERPLNYYEDKTFIGRIEYTPDLCLLLSVGVRYFSQLRFTYSAGARVFDSLLRSIGPVGRMQWEVGNHSQIIIDGWRERQTQRNAPSRSFTNMTLSVNVRL